MNKTERNASFDALRGIAILAVIGLHAARAGHDWKGRPGGEANFWDTVLLEQLLDFAVPAFLFVSGYFIARSRKARPPGEFCSLLRRRLTRILVPYCVWSVAVLSVFLLLHRISYSSALLRLFTGDALQPYYFMLLICQYYVLTPLLMRINQKPYGFPAVLLFNIVLLAAMYVIRLGFAIGIPRPLFALPFYSWIVFYQYGLWIGANPHLERTVAGRPRLFAAVTVVGFFLSCVEAVIMMRYFDNVHYATTAIKLSSFVYSLGLLSWFLWLKDQVSGWNGTIVAIGRNSFGIYLTHDLFLVPIIRLLYPFHALDAVQPLFQSACVALTLCICLTLTFVSRRILSSDISTRIFGL